MKNQRFFFVEMTDTFAGEANYSWCHRFKVSAASVTGAIRKVSRETGFVGRLVKESDFGDLVRHNVRGAAICFFTEEWDSESHSHYSHVIEL